MEYSLENLHQLAALEQALCLAVSSVQDTLDIVERLEKAECADGLNLDDCDQDIHVHYINASVQVRKKACEVAKHWATQQQQHELRKRKQEEEEEEEEKTESVSKTKEQKIENA